MERFTKALHFKKAQHLLEIPKGQNPNSKDLKHLNTFHFVPLPDYLIT